MKIIAEIEVFGGGDVTQLVEDAEKFWNMIFEIKIILGPTH